MDLTTIIIKCSYGLVRTREQALIVLLVLAVLLIVVAIIILNSDGGTMPNTNPHPNGLNIKMQ